MKTEFKEKQKFNQLFTTLPLTLLTLFLGFKNWTYYNETGNMSNSLLVSLSITGVITILFATMVLKTTVDQNGISMQFFPFLKRKFKMGDIQHLSVIDYGFIGGWGIRLTPNYNVVYNTKGTKGLLIEMKSGDKYVIGTSKEDDIKAFLNQELNPK